jgi:hypothetical protein
MADLTTADKVAKYLRRALTSDESATAADAIKAATAYIEVMTGRSYTVDTEESVRYFDSEGQREIFIDPADEISAVAYEAWDGTETVYDNDIGFQYQILPKGDKKPKRSILFGFRPPKGVEVIKVTAKWGETAPEDIKLAATALVAELFGARSDGLKSRSIEGYSETYGDIVTEKPLIKAAIDNHTRVL